MSSLFEAPLSLKRASESKRERKKREKKRLRREREGREGDEQQYPVPPQLAEGFLVWLEQQEIEGPESWRAESLTSSHGSNASACGAAAERSARNASPKLSLSKTPRPGLEDGQHKLITLRMEAVDGEMERVVEITHWPFEIGRGKRCDFVIDDLQVSKVHCVLYYQSEAGGTLQIEDKSRSGVMVDGVWLPRDTRTPLEDDARISLGKKGRYVFRLEMQIELLDAVLEDATDDEGVGQGSSVELVLTPCRKERKSECFKCTQPYEMKAAVSLATYFSEAEETAAPGSKKRKRSQQGGMTTRSTKSAKTVGMEQGLEKRQLSKPQMSEEKPQADAKTEMTGMMPGEVALEVPRRAAWFEPLASRAKATWGEPVLSANTSCPKPWGVLHQSVVMNLGDAMDLVLRALKARHVFRLACTCRGMRDLVAGSTIWRSLYSDIWSHFKRGKISGSLTSVLRLDMPPDIWKKLFVNMVLYRKKSRESKKAKGGNRGLVCLQCPVKECGKTFKEPHVLHQHLCGETGARKGPAHHTMNADGMRHYCSHEFCPRYFSSCYLATRHAVCECARDGFRSIARRALGEGNFICSACKASFRFQSAFDAHFITTNDGTLCPSSKEAAAMLVKHLARAWGEDKGLREIGGENGLPHAKASVHDTFDVASTGGLDLTTLERLRHMRQEDAARFLGMSLWSFTKEVRKLGLQKWLRKRGDCQELLSSFKEQLRQFAASHSWPSEHGLKGCAKHVKSCKGGVPMWKSKVGVMYRTVNLGLYKSSVEAALAHDICLLANGKPQSGRSGAFARPAQPKDLNLLPPVGTQLLGVHVPASLLETAKLLVDAVKKDVAKEKLADSSIKVRWLQDLTDAAAAGTSAAATKKQGKKGNALLTGKRPSHS